MLEYVKTILTKVSFDLRLFERELRKAVEQYLRPGEVVSLRQWCYEHFAHSERHAEVLDGYFEAVI